MTSQPSGSARVCDHGDGLRMAVLIDEESRWPWIWTTRCAIAMASAAAVASSSSEALATSRPVRSQTIV